MERPFTQGRLFRFSLGKNNLRYLQIVMDFGSAFLFAFLIRKIQPSLPNSNIIMQIWLIAFTVMWLLTNDINKHFHLETYLNYARLLKIVSWSGIGYLLFFVMTRQFYSLRFLLSVSVVWLLWAIATRWMLDRFAPPLRGLAFESLSDSLMNHNKVEWTVTNDPKVIHPAKIDFLVMDFNKSYPTHCQELLTYAHTIGLPILSLPQVTEYLMGKVSMVRFNDSWIEETFYTNPIYLRFKRIIDILFTLFLLPILLPLCALISICIFVSMGRPIFFWQTRIGLDNKPFKMLKFRTMINNAEEIGNLSTEANDRRVTSLGTFLRKWRLDELMQFYNVLKGEMSLIGPRPEHEQLAKNFVENIPLFQVRHWLRPGITGWAQVMQGYTTNEEETKEKLRYDMFYLKNMSLWLDIIILFKTFMTIITGFGSR